MAVRLLIGQGNDTGTRMIISFDSLCRSFDQDLMNTLGFDNDVVMLCATCPCCLLRSTPVF